MWGRHERDIMLSFLQHFNYVNLNTTPIGHICPLKMISLSLSILSRDNFNATYLTYYDVIQRVQAQAIAVVHYACFSLNKFESQVSILWYNALCLITSYYAFNISSTKPNACMIFSQLQCALLIVTFINKIVDSWEVKMLYSGLIGHS